MRCTLCYTSAPLGCPSEFVEVTTLEDLLMLIRREGHPVIVWGQEGEEAPILEIYDDYRE